MQSLCVLPLFILAPFIGLPETLWVSPLQILGGSGPEYFSVTLFTLEPGAGTPRWQFFAPWSPAIGMVAVIHIFLSARADNPKLRTAGVVAGLAFVLLSQSRLALVALIVIMAVLFVIRRLSRPELWFTGVPLALLAGFMASGLIRFTGSVAHDFSSARADSSRVREILGRLALDRWQTEAPWFGHGMVENGPHLVEYMPIGSHHSWYGLLFVKGITGAVALAVPLAVTMIILGREVLLHRRCQTGFVMILVILIYSFGENIEMLAYLTWPAWFMTGCALGKADQDRTSEMIEKNDK